MGTLSKNVAYGPLGPEVKWCPETKLWALPFIHGSHSALVTLGRTLCMLNHIVPAATHSIRPEAQSWMLLGAQPSCESLSSGLPGLRSESAWHLRPWDSSPEVTIG